MGRARGLPPAGAGAVTFALAAVLATAITLHFAPGFWSFDSFQQYRQASGLLPLDAAHPLVMALLWRRLIEWFGTPASLLAFHQAVYWGALALLACLLARRTATRLVLLLLVGLWPPLVVTSLHVWKDVGMLVALLLAVALILLAIRRGRPMLLPLALAPLFYAAAVRINGALPAGLLALCAAYLFWRARGLAGGRLAGAVAASMLALALVFSAALAALNQGARQTWGWGTLAVWDLVSMSVNERRQLLPDYMRADPRRDVENVLPVVTAIGADRRIAVAERVELTAAWRQLLAERSELHTYFAEQGIAPASGDYEQAFASLGRFLNGGQPWRDGVPALLVDTGADTAIDPTAFSAEVAAFYRARGALLYELQVVDWLRFWRAKNSPTANYPIFRWLSPYPPPERQGQLLADWRAAVLAAPGAYLAHRAEVFATLLGVGGRALSSPFHPGIDREMPEIAFRSLDAAQLSRWLEGFDALARTPVYQPVWYLLLCLAVIALAGWRLPRGRGDPARQLLAATVAASGAANGLAMFFIATAADFRYMTWTIAAALVGALIVVVRPASPGSGVRELP